MVQDPNLSEGEKRSRLVDGLAPPALTVYRKSVQASGPSITAGEVLVQLRRAFGIACESGDLYLVFRETYQTTGEAPAEYLTRLEEALDRAISFGEVNPTDADSLRLTQFIKGCVYSEGLVAALQLRQRKETPPSFVDLLREVRVEQSAEVARMQRRQHDKPKKAHAHSVIAPAPSEEWAARLRDVNSQLAALQTEAPHAAPTVKHPARPSQESSSDLMAEISKLKREIEDLKRGNKGGQPRPRATNTFCYRCGLPDHMSNNCKAAPNAELVQQKLLERAAQTLGNDRGRLQQGQQVPKQ